MKFKAKLFNKALFDKLDRIPLTLLTTFQDLHICIIPYHFDTVI